MEVERRFPLFLPLHQIAVVWQRNLRDSWPPGAESVPDIAPGARRGKWRLARFRSARAGLRARHDRTPAIRPETALRDARAKSPRGGELGPYRRARQPRRCGAAREKDARPNARCRSRSWIPEAPRAPRVRG